MATWLILAARSWHFGQLPGLPEVAIVGNGTAPNDTQRMFTLVQAFRQLHRRTSSRHWSLQKCLHLAKVLAWRNEGRSLFWTGSKSHFRVYTTGYNKCQQQTWQVREASDDKVMAVYNNMPLNWCMLLHVHKGWINAGAAAQGGRSLPQLF